MSKAWVLVANHTHARVFEAEKRAGTLNEIESLVYPEGRMKAQELLSDAPGRAFDSQGQGRHAMAEPTSLRKQGAQKFARDIAHTLEKGRQEGRFDRLYIVAEPSMAGSLRLSMSSPCLATIAGESRKNLTTCDTEQIRAQLPMWL
ncbi:host attachment protein [Microbulbifer salipaludis]|uniref:Host attachment protein n=1 Tax=Microbulbifer salipaludis TaxID=187980 RepID=A0ABS3E4U5_9GAMM|nr:host attachment protein [Microbulbifer salipaludis]MBN8430277.1 host attachment protein [Microbulbifer salipaludis]